MKKFLLFLISLHCVVFIARCHDEMMILHSPRALTFEGSNELDRSYLKHVLSTALGYTVDTDNEWNNMKVENPFGLAKALFIIHLPGIETFNSSGNIYPVIPDENVEETYNFLVESIEKRNPDQRLDLKKVVLGDKSKVYPHQDMPYEMDVSSNGPIESISSSSRPKNENDNMFIKELNRLHSVTDELLSQSNEDSKPDVFWVTAPKMGQIMALRDGDSNDILLNALSTISQKVNEHYNDKVLVVAMTDGEELKKRSKRETNSDTEPTLVSLNVAEDYDEDFPVIFNIVFWFSLAMLFAVIAICLVIGNMDPGRDSIIYRMTSTRMKKDN